MPLEGDQHSASPRSDLGEPNLGLTPKQPERGSEYFIDDALVQGNDASDTTIASHDRRRLGFPQQPRI
jgi:hypothetical protein